MSTRQKIILLSALMLGQTVAIAADAEFFEMPSSIPTALVYSNTIYGKVLPFCLAKLAQDLIGVDHTTSKTIGEHDYAHNSYNYHYENDRGQELRVFTKISYADARLFLYFWNTNNSSDEISLVSVGAFPQLVVKSSQPQQCTQNEWGVTTGCSYPNGTSYNYAWRVQQNYQFSSPWMNYNNGVLLNKTSNFANYMDCVEKKAVELTEVVN